MEIQKDGKHYKYFFYINSSQSISPLPQEDENNFLIINEYDEIIFNHCYGMGSVHYPVLVSNTDIDEFNSTIINHNKNWAKYFLDNHISKLDKETISYYKEVLKTGIRTDKI